ncbi:MAG: methylornithine synthase PylB [Candidatus Methylarchaceae archaeon HK01B]|nr:methylornithine synthase PylB [Candidatus Methylarchaceae archaeon HK01M]MCP8311863.1 methylornithine synthase PylB [Candidatus Methylarchaceae archaeon HK02M1]MCP8318417.1 methylornithine synthase PylB [Candidatus Methylarchaceae archaeon HK01B]
MTFFDFNPRDSKVMEILTKALDGKELSKRETLHLARIKNIHDLYAMFSAAQELRERFFKNVVFTYGFIYFTTYCRNSCTFCAYRKPNNKAIRYRKSLDEILDYSNKIKDSGINLIDLTMSEDPLIYERVDGWRLIENIVKAIKEATGLPIMASPGAICRDGIRALRRAGADWFAVYQETYNRELYRNLRLYQDFDYRVKVKLWAKSEGMLIEDGMLLGVGETEKDWVNSVFSMKSIGAHQVREMGFIPQANTPMENIPPPPLLNEMKVIALMRLINPDKLIPSSFDVDGIKGLQLRLMAGANVVTSLIPPRTGLVGVAQAELGVDSGIRTRDGIQPFMKQLNFRLASQKEYAKWVEEQRAKLQTKREL